MTQSEKRGIYVLLQVSFFLIMMVALNCNLVSGQTIVEIPNPEIYVSFFGEEVVIIEDYGLYNETGHSFLVSEVIDDRYYDPQTQLHFFHFKSGVLDNPFDPRNYLKNGYYFFAINATDESQVPQLNIVMTAPRHSVSSVPIFPVEITTGRGGNVSNSSECRFNLNADRTWANMIHFFTPTDTPFNSSHISVENISVAQRMYIRCKDIYENTYLNTFDLEIDTTPPAIYASYANPNPVVEEIDSNIQTELVVNTDEPVICKYDNTSANYTDLRYNFTDFDPYDSDTFSTTKTTLLKFLDDNTTYIIYVGCENLAGLVQNNFTITFTTNLDAPLTIGLSQPSPQYGDVDQYH